MAKARRKRTTAPVGYPPDIKAQGTRRLRWLLVKQQEVIERLNAAIEESEKLRDNASREIAGERASWEVSKDSFIRQIKDHESLNEQLEFTQVKLRDLQERYSTIARRNSATEGALLALVAYLAFHNGDA